MHAARRPSAHARETEAHARRIPPPRVVNGGGEGQQFFSDGLSEALIIALSQFDGLKAIGLGLSMTTEAKAIPGAMCDTSAQLDCSGRV